MRIAIAAFFAIAALFGARLGNAQTAGSSEPRLLRPIIAQLYAEPRAFAGRTIAVYGLVVERKSSGTIFMLQDVSQRPLKVVGSKSLKAAVGDQLTVVGKFHPDASSPYVTAKFLVPTRVLGGGGCC